MSESRRRVHNHSEAFCKPWMIALLEMGCRPYRKLPVVLNSSRNQDDVLSIFRGYNGSPSELDMRYLNLPTVCGDILSTAKVSQRKYWRGLPSPVTSHTMSPSRNPARLSVTMPNIFFDGWNGPILSGLWYWTKWRTEPHSQRQSDSNSLICA